MADPIAKSIVEIDANIAPLQQKLEAAKASVVSASAQMQGSASAGGKGGGAAAISATAGPAFSFANSGSEILRNAKSYAEVMANAEAFIAKNSTAANGLAGGMKGAAEQSKFLNIGVAATAGAVAAVGRAANELWKGIKGFSDGARGIANDLRAIESQFRSDITASLDPLTARREEIEKSKQSALEQLETEKTQRGIIGDIVGLVTDEAEQKIKIQKIEAEAIAAQARLRKKAEDDAKKAQEDAAKKKADEEKKSFQEAEKIARDLYIQSLDERGQLEARFNDEMNNLQDKRNNAKSLAEKRVYDEAMTFRENIFQKDLKDLEEKANQEKKVTKEKAQDLEKQRRDFLKAQEEQFAGLREQINNLFNSGNLEVGIDRVGALIQTLIDKTENVR